MFVKLAEGPVPEGPLDWPVAEIVDELDHDEIVFDADSTEDVIAGREAPDEPVTVWDSENVAFSASDVKEDKAGMEVKLAVIVNTPLDMSTVESEGS